MNRNTLVTILIIIASFVMFAYLQDRAVKAKAKAANSSNYIVPAPIAENENYRNVLAIDLADDKDFTEQAIIIGHDVLLMLHKGEQGSSFHGDDVIQSANLLLSLDADNNGRIDVNDPFFRRLELLQITGKGERISVMSAWDAGIRAIIINDTTRAIALKDSAALDRIVGSLGHVVLSDSSHRQIRMVPIQKTYLRLQGKKLETL